MRKQKKLTVPIAYLIRDGSFSDTDSAYAYLRACLRRSQSVQVSCADAPLVSAEVLLRIFGRLTQDFSIPAMHRLVQLVDMTPEQQACWEEAQEQFKVRPLLSIEDVKTLIYALGRIIPNRWPKPEVVDLRERMRAQINAPDTDTAIMLVDCACCKDRVPPQDLAQCARCSRKACRDCSSIADGGIVCDVCAATEALADPEELTDGS